jgi:hypothetical protein
MGTIVCLLTAHVAFFSLFFFKAWGNGRAPWCKDYRIRFEKEAGRLDVQGFPPAKKARRCRT